MNATSLQTINSRDRKYKWIHSKFSDNCSRKCHCLIRSIEQENTFHARLQCKHKSANIRTHALEPRLSEQIELVCVAYHAWFWGIRWCSPHNTCMNYATIYFYQHKPWSCRYFFFFGIGHINNTENCCECPSIAEILKRKTSLPLYYYKKNNNNQLSIINSFMM